MTEIPRHPLFAGGPEVSRLCLGTMLFGAQTSEAEAGRILDRFMAAGGDFVDTADTYVGGESERILGRLLADRRDRCFSPPSSATRSPTPNESAASPPAYMRRAVAASLDRLAVDTIDLYYLHLDDETTPLEDIVGTLGELIAQGRIRHWGFSNFRPWKVAEMVRVADAQGVARPVVAQPYYHMLNRVAETDLLPACRHFGIGVVPYSPLARGVLTGKYRDEAPPADSRAARKDPRLMETEFRPETIAAANAAADRARSTGRDPAAVALQWVLANRAISAVLIGPRTLDQLEGYLAAIGVPFDAADEAACDALCPSGLTPAPLYADPRYPYRGRFTNFAATG